MAPLPWALAFVVGALASVPLLLSDRAPRLIRDSLVELELADDARRLALGFDPYLAGHAAMWGALAFAAVMALHRRVPAWAVAVVVWMASVGSEVLQGAATRVRTFESIDIAANALGVVSGTIAAWLLVQVVRLVRVVRR